MAIICQGQNRPRDLLCSIHLFLTSTKVPTCLRKKVEESLELSIIMPIFARRSVRNSAAPQQLERAPLRSACTSFANCKDDEYDKRRMYHSA